MTTDLDDIVAVIQTRVPYLRCATTARAEDGWIRCADLLDHPALLGREIAATAAGRGTTDAQVAASLYAQAYGFRVPSIAIAAHALGLPVPTVEPAAMAIRIARHRPAELAILRAECSAMEAATLAPALFAHHLAPFIAAVRSTTTIGERLLWGNIAASIATIFRAVQSTGDHGDPAVRERATAFEAAAAPWLRGLGSWSSIETPVALGWFWDRTSCCLWYRTETGSYCDDCSLLDRDQLAATRLAGLTGSRTR